MTETKTTIQFTITPDEAGRSVMVTKISKKPSAVFPGLYKYFHREKVMNSDDAIPVLREWLESVGLITKQPQDKGTTGEGLTPAQRQEVLDIVKGMGTSRRKRLADKEPPADIVRPKPRRVTRRG